MAHGSWSLNELDKGCGEYFNDSKDVNGHLAFGTRFPPTGAREFFAFTPQSLSRSSRKTHNYVAWRVRG